MVITSARTGTSRELASREKRYAITMAIRTACFVSMIFVSGPMRWVLLAGAVFLPYIAVLLANQANTKTPDDAALQQTTASAAPELTAGPASPEVISGELLDDDLEPGKGPADSSTAYLRHDRVA